MLAAHDDRCFVTEDRRDFIRLTVVFFEQHQPHAGVLLLPSSLPARHFAGVARALSDYSEAHPSATMSYVVDYL